MTHCGLTFPARVLRRCTIIDRRGGGACHKQACPAAKEEGQFYLSDCATSCCTAGVEYVPVLTAGPANISGIATSYVHGEPCITGCIGWCCMLDPRCVAPNRSLDLLARYRPSHRD
jgi:hypothetical protein